MTNPQAVQSMVERVARSLWIAAQADPSGSADIEHPIFGWRRLERDARAAIEAMKMPTQEMELAAENALDPPFCRIDARDAWDAMISAALADSVVG